MNTYLGIDLGTSSIKLTLMEANGKILKTSSKEYDLIFPRPGWSEQSPSEWKDALFFCLKEIFSTEDPKALRGIGCGGQMHGLVILDKDDNVIRPAILWNDGRTDREVAYLNEVIGMEKLSEMTANIAFAGFTAPKLLWMRNNEPELFSKIDKIMLPKDYINYILTGVHCCDYSDASGMLLLDVKNRCWSDEMLEICHIEKRQMPRLFESYEKVGNVKRSIAEEYGLNKDVTVCAGAGDNAAAAIGTGTVGNGGCNISLGTSGTIFISSEKFLKDENNALHAFAHADGGYHLMGCMLSAASCHKWLMENVYMTDDPSAIQKEINDDMLGDNDVYFLPYMMGERSPINDTNARGTFTGMTLNTTRGEMTLAVMEGVAFALRDSFEIAKSLGLKIKESKICGGGSKSRLWVKIISNVLNIPLLVPGSEQGPGVGGAILAMVCCGEYENVGQACGDLVKTKEIVSPDENLSKKYDERYKRFKTIYPALKDVFKKLR